MAVNRMGPEVLVGLAIETLKTELAPHLPAERRYTAAMVLNALEIARRDIMTEGESDGWKLLDELYDDGEGSMRQLASDIRRGAISETTKPGLAAKLRDLVIGELKIKNPRFLKSRGIG